MVSENSVLRIILRSKREGGWRRLHDEELQILYASTNIWTIRSRTMRWAGNVRYMSGWENNITMDLREVIWKDVDWKHLDRNRDQWRVVLNNVMILWVP
jgi:hypothetical protein